jgi:hypothetical protein
MITLLAMSFPPGAAPSDDRGSTPLRDPNLPPRWYVVALVVGVAMAALPAAVGIIVGSLGDAVGACNNEMGCFFFYMFGICVAPLGFIFGSLASGLTAWRLASENASLARTWKASFGAGFVALFPAALVTLLVLASH